MLEMSFLQVKKLSFFLQNEEICSLNLYCANLLI
jgi:hypothetical protein